MVPLVTFVVWDQINGRVKRAHANDLKLAGLEEWEVPKEKEKKQRIRRTRISLA